MTKAASTTAISANQRIYLETLFSSLAFLPSHPQSPQLVSLMAGPAGQALQTGGNEGFSHRPGPQVANCQGCFTVE